LHVCGVRDVHSLFRRAAVRHQFPIVDKLRLRHRSGSQFYAKRYEFLGGFVVDLVGAQGNALLVHFPGGVVL
jgi:hypothetical protein